MIKGRYVLGLGMLLLITACSSSDKAPKVEQTSPQNSSQGTVETFIQSRVNVLNKAKGLEKTLQDAEDRRLKTIQGFSEQE